MKRLLFVVVLLAALVGCKGQGVPEPNSSGSVEFHFIGEVDGARIYRFWDGTSFVYVAVKKDTVSIHHR